jgi:hypothetical protein
VPWSRADDPIGEDNPIGKEASAVCRDVSVPRITSRERSVVVLVEPFLQRHLKQGHGDLGEEGPCRGPCVAADKAVPDRQAESGAFVQVCVTNAERSSM